jgi:hypothetical protein
VSRSLDATAPRGMREEGQVDGKQRKWVVTGALKMEGRYACGEGANGHLVLFWQVGVGTEELRLVLRGIDSKEDFWDIAPEVNLLAMLPSCRSVDILSSALRS